MRPFPLPLILATSLLSGGCGDRAPAPAAPGAAADATVPPAEAGACRVPGAALPADARLFVVDGAEPVPDTEPGREAIRRVDVVVPGPVALVLTAPDPTVWALRPSPETQLVAVFAGGDAPQRITGQGLPDRQHAVSVAGGQACARHGSAAEDAGRLADAAFGRAPDARYRMRLGRTVIGGHEGSPPEP